MKDAFFAGERTQGQGKRKSQAPERLGGKANQMFKIGNKVFFLFL